MWAKSRHLRASLVTQTVKNLLAMWETQIQSLFWGRSPEEGNGNPLQYSCLKKSMDRGAGWARDLSYLCKGPMVFGTGQVPLSEGRGGKGKDQRLVLDDMGHLHVFHC